MTKPPAKPKASRTQKTTSSKDTVLPKITSNPETEKRDETKISPETSSTAFPPEDFKALESLSVNLAKAAMTAQSALAGTLLTPKIEAQNADPFQVAPAMGSVMNALMQDPQKIIKAQSDLFTGYVSLWGQMANKAMALSSAVAGGDSTPSEPAPKKVNDKRFADESWQSNPVFEVMRDSYLLSSNWLNNLVASAEGVDAQEKRRVTFFTKLMTDALSPSNFLFSNPVALKTLVETKGESLVKGMEQFAEDLARGDGRLAISQADYDRFKVGENMATTGGDVIYRGPLFELIQYKAATEKVKKIPLLIFPPWINKFYILDLQPKNSMIKWLTEQGFSVFLVSWINPDQTYKDVSFEDYMFGGIYEAIKQVKIQTGEDKVDTVGYCIGGTLLGCALAHMAAKGDQSVNTATFFTAQHDFSEAGDLLLFTTDNWIKELERKMDAAGGVLPGSDMADTFNILRVNDLIWSFYVNNYLLGKDPPPFDLLCWNADQTRMAKAVHIFYLRQFYGANALSKGELELGGVKLDLSKVKTPIFTQSGREDHIAPPASVYRGSKLFGGDVTYVLAGSGHIAGVVNHPDAKKYQYWLNDERPDSLSQWQEKAVEHAGSWWPYWAEWLKNHDGNFVPARDANVGPLNPIEAAPGSYVKVKS